MAVNLRGKLRAAFSRKFWLHHHMAVLFALVIGSGMLANHVLKLYGVWALPLRYALVVTIAYLAFFPAGFFWLAYIRRELEDDPTWPRQVASAHAPARLYGHTEDNGPLGLCDGVELADAVSSVAEAGTSSELGCALLFILPLLLLIMVSGGYVLWQAPLILTDAAFETLLAFALVKPVRSLSLPETSTGLFGATCTYYLLMLAAAVLVGFAASVMSPGARTLGEALQVLF